MAEQETSGVLAGLSRELADAVAAAGQSVVRVDARRRYPASGIVWTADGHIVTADHVLEREEDITVGLADGTDAPAKLVGRDPSTDLALLKVEKSGLTAARPAPVEEARVGNIVLAVGRPTSGGLQAT